MIQRDIFLAELRSVFERNGLSRLLNEEKCGKFLSLTERMLEENEKYNLTAITDTDKIILNHYADCAALAEVLPSGASVCDVGCGAGFPTLPIAILREDITVLGIDSTAKRIAYVNETARLLELKNVRAVAMRAEEGGKNSLYREKFDVATARAVANLQILSELCLPYVKVGGAFLAMKGRGAAEELRSAALAIGALGGADISTKEIELCGKEEVLSHPLITVRKVKKTPGIYPRPYAKILKKPL